MGQQPIQRYSWEAIYAVDFTLESVRRRCRTLAEALAARRWSCLVAFDTRFLGAQFAIDCARLLQSGGVNVTFSGLPSPYPAVALALDQRRADSALIVSAGNRPYWQNGLIVLAPAADAALIEPAPASPPAIDIGFPPAEGNELATVDLRQLYIEHLRTAIDVELIRRSPLTMFADLMTGSAGGIIPAVLGDGAQAKAIEINREPDALFLRQAPQPTDAGLQRLRKLVKESNSHFGAAISADGRALSIVDNHGELVPPYRTALLLAQYMARQYRQRGAIVIPNMPAERAEELRQWEERTGLKIEQAPDPAARITEIVARDRTALLAGVTATGELTLGRLGAGPDGTLVALALAECAARSGERLHDLLNGKAGS
jgi:phosphomannomutase